ncbi:MAG: DNA polymerase/3'-5' exonuclease PolX [bacterium JZ-2024 1]
MDNNRILAKMFDRIGDALEIKGENQFKILAYRKVARVLKDLPKDVSEYLQEGSLAQIPGVGEAIAKKIEEFLTTGKMTKYEEEVKSLPEGLFEILEVPEVGPKTVKLVYEKLGVTNLEEFRKIVEDGTLAQLPGMGEKKVENIKKGLQFRESVEKRLPLGEALPIAERTVNRLKTLPHIKFIDVAGSIRRWKETIGDIDILVVTDQTDAVMELFVNQPEVTRVLAQGETKSSIILENRVQMDLRVVDAGSYGSALAYFTGSKEHNVRIRDLAKKMGLKISEYGIFHEEEKKGGEKEEDIYNVLGLPYIPPELREDRGEIEAAQQGNLPRLVELSDIRGDLHVHSKYSDGTQTIEELMDEAEKMGYEYIAVADHSQSVKWAHGMSVERIQKQWEEIERIQKKRKKVRILKAAEVDILSDGTVDYPDEILRKLDFVIVAVHIGWKDNTERILKALDHPRVNALSHPTGRLINQRDPYPIDLKKILQKAKEKGIFLELNSHYLRLDLNDVWCRVAKEMGIPIYLGTDSHSPGGMSLIRYGIGQARRGWLEKKDVLNTLTYEELKKVLEKKRKNP